MPWLVAPRWTWTIAPGWTAARIASTSGTTGLPLAAAARPIAAASNVSGRHARPIAVIGCASGYLSVAVLAYCTGFDHALFTRYSAIWLGFALMLYWIAHIWLRARAGRIDDDPVIYALGDRPSQIAAILGAAIALISA
jgi:phenylacetate-coenzyme A ligase PaaK-like adenylate-forming protein